MEETTNVTQDSLPAEQVEGAEATTANENAQAQENPTPEQGVAQEGTAQPDEQSIPYSRFKEVNGEKNWYKQQLETLLNSQKQTVQPIQQPVQQELGNTPEEREFWRQQRAIAREEAEKVAKEKEGRFQTQLEALNAQQARSMEKEFRSKHPDVKPGSMEEAEIAARIQRGYDHDDAYWSVMGARGVANAKSQAVKEVKNNIAQKKQANVEHSPGVSPQIKSQPAKTMDEIYAENWLKMERGEL